MADRVGQHLGNYHLLRSLGQGAFATVYLGEHQYLERLAAIKVLHMRMEASTHEAFRREARTIARLHHPHIIAVHDFGFEDNTPYLVIEYMQSGTLREHFPKGMRLPVEQVIVYAKQIASALDYAHEQHVIHRDVKPENVLLGTDHEAVLSDFGIAVVQQTLDSLSVHHPAGTPIYMAPEQIQHKPDFASDQYALGVMVYEWLCGEPPFHGSLFEVLAQHMHKPPPSLRDRLPTLAPAVEDAVFGALAKDPRQRFGSVTDFARALEEAFFATQPDLSGGELQNQTALLLTRSTGKPISSPSEQTSPDEMTQPRDPHIQRTNHSPESRVPISSQSARPHPPATSQSLPAQEPTPVPAGRSQNRVRMLGRLRRSYNDLMRQSLQGTVWLELGLVSKPDAVQNATHVLWRTERRAEQPLPPGTPITQVYDEVEQELLILGEPGAGKSTLLLDLAQQLVIRAEQDERHPLPVVLPLSTWAIKRESLEDWIAEQVAEIYDIPRKLSLQWVQEDGILPLLDGLDEVEETARPACIAAINTYHGDHMTPLVVCSRTTEYEATIQDHRLTLQGAVAVQPLTLEYVDAYLESAGEPLTALRSALKKNGALQNLSTTPLMLNILLLTYQGTSVNDLSSQKESLLQKLVWDDYVQRMVTRKGSSRSSPLTQTRATLGWLARQMRDHNQTVFYLEHLQPNWLSTRGQSIYAWRAIRLPAVLIGVLMSILVQSLFFGSMSFSYRLQYRVLGGLLGGLWRRPLEEELEKRQEHHHEWGKRLVKRLLLSACIGVIYGLSFGFYLGPDYTFSHWMTDGLSYGGVIGLSSLLLQYLLIQPFPLGASAENSAPRRWKHVVRFFRAVHGPRALLVAVIIGLSVGLSYGLRFGLNVGLSDGLSIGLSIGLSYGLTYALISLALGAQMGDIHPTEHLSWTWRSLRRSLFNSEHIHTSLVITCISMVSIGLSSGLIQGLTKGPTFGFFQGLSFGLSNGLNFGLSYWCLLGLFQGIAQERIEDRDRRRPNQGIHRSLRNSMMMGIIGGVLIGIIGILSFGLSNWLRYTLGNQLALSFTSSRPDIGLIYGLGYSPILGISGGLLIFLLTGGLAVLRHYIIRLLLWHSHTFPMHAPQFLDDATARYLLQRVGGGYSFSHRLLLDHLANAAESESRAPIDIDADALQQARKMREASP